MAKMTEKNVVDIDNDGSDGDSDDSKSSIFIIIRSYPGMNDRVQAVWDGMDFLDTEFGYDFVGGSVMYLGTESQLTGPKENRDSCVERIHQYLATKYADPENGIVDFWVKAGNFGELWDLDKKLCEFNRKYGKEYLKMKNATNIQRKFMGPIV